jgi:hypothetical protein
MMTRSHVYISIYYWMKICEISGMGACMHTGPTRFFKSSKRKKKMRQQNHKTISNSAKDLLYIPYTTPSPHQDRSTTPPDQQHLLVVVYLTLIVVTPQCNLPQFPPPLSRV